MQIRILDPSCNKSKEKEKKLFLFIIQWQKFRKFTLIFVGGRGMFVVLVELFADPDQGS